MSKKKILFSLLTILITCGIVYLIEFQPFSEKKYYKKPLEKYWTFVKREPLLSKPSILSKYANTTMIHHYPHPKGGFDATYEFDEYGRRKLPFERRPKHLLMFGGSNIFGEGLNNNQTIGYKVFNAQKEYQPYIYAYLGWSAAEMLYLLKQENIKEQVEPQNGTLVYFMYDFHIGRVLGTRAVFRWRFGYAPYFDYNSNNELEYKGMFVDSRFWKNTLFKIQNNSIIYRFFESLFFDPSKSWTAHETTKEEQLLFCDVILESKKQYLTIFPNSSFLVVLLGWIPTHLQECFESKQIKFFLLEEPKDRSTAHEYHYQYADGHLTENAINFIYPQVLKKIQ